MRAGTAARTAFNSTLGLALLAAQAVSGEWHWIPSALAASLLGLPVAELAHGWVLGPLAARPDMPPTSPSSARLSPPSPGSPGVGEP